MTFFHRVCALLSGEFREGRHHSSSRRPGGPRGDRPAPPAAKVAQDLRLFLPGWVKHFGPPGIVSATRRMQDETEPARWDICGKIACCFASAHLPRSCLGPKK